MNLISIKIINQAHEQTTMTVRLSVPVTASARDQQAKMWPQRPRGKLISIKTIKEVRKQTTMTVRLSVPVTASARDQQVMMWPQRPRGKLNSIKIIMEVRNQSTMTVRFQVAAKEALQSLTRPMRVAQVLITMTTASARGQFT